MGGSKPGSGAAPFTGGPWWGHPVLIFALILASGAPLWWPAIAPLTDLPGHMGRYLIQLDGGQTAALSRWYSFDWQWIGNLGVDLLVQLLGPVLGVEAATKLITIAIAMLGTAGFLAVARQIHGRIPPTAFFALPLIWSLPFLWGFVNFALSMALACFAYVLWLRLADAGRLGLRAALFVPLSLLLWTVHIYGWAVLCVLAGTAELDRQIRARDKLSAALTASCVSLLCLLPPLGPMVLRFGEGGAGGQPFGHTWFRFDLKTRWLLSVFKDRWEVFDIASVGVIVLVLILALAHWAVRRTRSPGTPLALGAGVLALLFLILPHALLGSAYADMRLAPYVLAFALLAIDGGYRQAGLVAAAGLTFFAARTTGSILSAKAYDDSYRAELAALDHLPRGARLISFVGRPCAEGWSVHRLDHLPSIALVRKGAFANDQWQASGAQLLKVTYQAAGQFRSDPSQFVVAPRCERHERVAITRALTTFPRDAFDYVWIIRQPAGPADMRGLVPVWKQGTSGLYRIVRTG